MVKLPEPPGGGTQNLNKSAVSSLPVSPVQPPSPPISGLGLGVKERESFEQQEAMQLEEVRKELELAPEVKETGVEIQNEEIELPPPLPKMGVNQIGTEIPIVAPTINLPLNDDKIVNGLGASIWSSLCWLANWCFKQLKKAHVKLKKVHGEIIRTVIK